jgi:hypothetical protein
LLIRLCVVAATLATAASPSSAAVAPRFTITFSLEPPATADTGTAVFDFTATLPASFVCFLDGSKHPTRAYPGDVYVAPERLA